MNILFVCTGNTCRSPMAAALFNKIAMERDLNVKIESAGLFANEGEAASEGAKEAMKVYDIDLLGHSAKNINQELLEGADIVLCMTCSHKMVLKQYLKDKVYTLLEFAGMTGDVPDPYGKGVSEYKACAESLYAALLKVADRI